MTDRIKPIAADLLNALEQFLPEHLSFDPAHIDPVPLSWEDSKLYAAASATINAYLGQIYALGMADKPSKVRRKAEEHLLDTMDNLVRMQVAHAFEQQAKAKPTN